MCGGNICAMHKPLVHCMHLKQQHAALPLPKIACRANPPADCRDSETCPQVRNTSCCVAHSGVQPGPSTLPREKSEALQKPPIVCPDLKNCPWFNQEPCQERSPHSVGPAGKSKPGSAPLGRLHGMCQTTGIPAHSSEVQLGQPSISQHKRNRYLEQLRLHKSESATEATQV